VSDDPGDWFEEGEGSEDWFEGADSGDWMDDERSGGNPFGGGSSGGGFGDPEDFASAFDTGMGETGFEEEFDSDIPRIDLGIEGLDEMVQGGVPERSLLVAIGAAGTGKTTFGLQFLREGIENDEKGVFITLEGARADVLEAAGKATPGGEPATEVYRPGGGRGPNNVSLEREVTKLSRNSLEVEQYLSILDFRIRRMKTALRSQ